ncbi:MAG: PAS domain-containing sensor histidine kinase [Opitutaceae bacterium]
MKPQTRPAGHRAFPAPSQPASSNAPHYHGFYMETRSGETAPGDGGATADDILLERTLVKAFLQNVPDSVYFKDQGSRFLAVSTSMAGKHGYAHPDEMIGRTDFDTFSDEHARQAFEDEMEIIRTGEPVIGKIEKETWPGGSITWVTTSKMPLRNDNGEVIGTFGISKDITAQKEMEARLEAAHKQLLDTSRLAGMAEVATGVLHNVGNVLNSVNVSSSQIADSLRQSKIVNLGKACQLLREHAGDLAAFFTRDPKGQRLPSYLESLSEHLLGERDRLLEEVAQLRQNIEHIKDIVSMQQSYAMVSGIVEPHNAADLVEDSLRMNTAALLRHEVSVVREFQTAPLVKCEKPKVLQILVNLIRNAKYAMDDSGREDKQLTLRIEHDAAAAQVRLIVRDNGIGIAPENLARIFAHGFTTRKDGHGFGLHSSANAAKEMGGALAVHSEGPGRGAAFTLVLPCA